MWPLAWDDFTEKVISSVDFMDGWMDSLHADGLSIGNWQPCMHAINLLNRYVFGGTFIWWHSPGARPTNGISIEFEIRSKFGML